MKHIVGIFLFIFWTVATAAFAIHLYYYYEKQENRSVAGMSREAADHKILQNIESLIKINTDIRDTYQKILAEELRIREILVDKHFTVLERIESKIDKGTK